MGNSALSAALSLLPFGLPIVGQQTNSPALLRPDTITSIDLQHASLSETRAVDTHVRRLRKILGKAAEVMETMHGFGYRLCKS